MSIPVYSNTISSDLLRRLHGIGYTSWCMFDSRAPNVFYQLLGHAVITHMTFRHSATDFFDNYFNRSLQNFTSVTGGDMNCIYTPTYWSSLGETLKNALVKIIEKPRFKEAISSGQPLDKSSQRDCIDEIAKTLCVALTWYEMTSQDIITCSFLRKGSRTAFMYICIAEEVGNFYLLFHEKFKPECVTEGFPFFEKSGSATSRIPQLGDTVRRTESGAEALTKCIETQQLLIGQLLDIVLATVPQQLSPQLAAQQKAVHTTAQALEEFYHVCSLPPPEHGGKMKAFLSLAETQVEEAIPEAAVHTIQNCDQFLTPNDYRIQHIDHAFCFQHLSEYWNQYKSKQCPRCEKDLPDTVIKALDPTFYQQKSNARTMQTVARQAPESRFPTSTLPTVQNQCSLTSNHHSGGVFTMACNYHVCAMCLSTHQMKPGYRGFCPICNNPLNAIESGYVHQAWTSTSRY